MNRSKEGGSFMSENSTKRTSNPTADYVVTPKTKVRYDRKSSTDEGKISKSKLSIANKVSDIFEKETSLQNACQGTFEVFINSLDLSQVSLTYLVGRANKNFDLKINWRFMEYVSSTAYVKFENNYVGFNSLVVHNVMLGPGLIEEINANPLLLVLTAVYDADEVFLGSASVEINDVLMYPQNIIYKHVEMYGSDNMKHCGSLSLWYRLNCEQQALNYMSDRSTTKPSPKLFHDRSPANNTESEVAAFQSALELVLTRNNALKTTNSEIAKELQERTKWLHDESNWLRTLQEYAILEGKDPKHVKWRQWRVSHTTHVKLRSFKNNKLYSPEVVFTVNYLTLSPHSTVAKNEDIVQLYVEFIFLSHEGEAMEFPTCVSKRTDGEAIVFNFSRSFNIDLEESPQDSSDLAQWIKEKRNMALSIVSEPEEDLSKFQICTEVGICKINLFDLVQSEENRITREIVVLNPRHRSEKIGLLSVSINGIQAMRRTALLILSSSDYTTVG